MWLVFLVCLVSWLVREWLVVVRSWGGWVPWNLGWVEEDRRGINVERSGRWRREVQNMIFWGLELRGALILTRGDVFFEIRSINTAHCDLDVIVVIYRVSMLAVEEI